MTTTTAAGTYFGRVDQIERLLGQGAPASRRGLFAAARLHALRAARAVRGSQMAQQWDEAIEQPKSRPQQA